MKGNKMKIITSTSGHLLRKVLAVTKSNSPRAVGILAIALALTVTVASAGNSFFRFKPHAPVHFRPINHCENVLPPKARVFGYSLDDMAAAVANFSISGNDPAFYPNTPFQIIYNRPDNTYTVKPGTYLYLKFFFIDDSAPVVGDWPANKWAAANYIFGPNELGGHDLQVEIDGKTSSLDDPGYIGGPVPTPNSPDGSEHMIQIGAFVAPLAKGTHMVIIRGVFDGAAILDAFGGPFEAEITYTVIVK
jgi:hypothetical protein